MRIAIVDDHTLFRKGMIALLERIEGIKLVLEAANGREFLDQLEETPIDLVLLDLMMPVFNGRQTLQILRTTYPDIKVIILTMENSEETVLHLVEDGAHGFLAKDAHPKEVKEAIQNIAEHGTYLNPRTSQILMQGLADWKTGQRQPGLQLSEREMQILQGICMQQSTAEIADQLFLSPRTVEGYRRTLLEKTNTKNSIGLVLFAARNGWLEQWLNN